MKKIVFISMFALCVISISAQQKFNVQNGTKAEFYDDLETAIQKAVSGDTIYLPGAIVQVNNNLIIDKKLAIIGAGCDVDSIGGVQTTEIKKTGGSVTINYRNGSDGSLLTGCIVSEIQFGHQDEFNVYQQDIKKVTILRNKISRIILGLSSTNNFVKQIIISENIIEYNTTNGIPISGVNASECIINNNLCSGQRYGISNFKNSRIYNNIVRVSGDGLSGLNECVIENNFFAAKIYSCSNSFFNNNAFTSNVTFPNGSNTGSNNLINQETIRTFTVDNLTLPKNLKIRDDSPCKNAGTDGTDIGIYGGSTPYKAGAVPPQPHIDKFLVSPQADKAGNLKVAIQVSSQTR